MWTQCSIEMGLLLDDGIERIDAMEGDAMMHLLTEGLNGGEDAGG